MEFGELTIEKARMSDQVKNVLKQAMMNGKLRSGDKIPTEEKMAQQFKVSKVTIREALRDLESEGLIVKRRGMAGGSFVATPGPEKTGDLLVNYFLLGEVSPEELAEFRQIFEPAIITLAAERRTDEDLEAIRAYFDATSRAKWDGKPRIGMRPKAGEFWCLIADACHNRMISIVMKALVMVYMKVLSDIEFSREDIEFYIAHREKIYDSLVHRQSDKARNLMIALYDELKRVVERNKRDKSRKRKN
jgi:DNA-binding FadR family transcriptional regulator